MATEVSGLKVVGVDARAGVLALIREAAADVIFDARVGNEKDGGGDAETHDGEWVHSALNVSDAKSAAPSAAAITREHGTVVQVVLVSVLPLSRLHVDWKWSRC